MSKKEKDVELIPWSMANSGWKVKHDGKEGTGPGPENYPKLKFETDTGPHLMVFTLPKNGNTQFNKDNPIAIVKGTESPEPDAGIDPQFPDWAIFDGGKTLVVLNSNSGEAAQYTYAVKADNYAKELDPIVDNGGGGQPPPPPPPGFGGGTGGGGYDASWLIGAAVLGALITVAFVRLILRWRPL